MVQEKFHDLTVLRREAFIVNIVKGDVETEAEELSKKGILQKVNDLSYDIRSAVNYARASEQKNNIVRL